jgi:NAD+ diphosphatase
MTYLFRDPVEGLTLGASSRVPPHAWVAAFFGEKLLMVRREGQLALPEHHELAGSFPGLSFVGVGAQAGRPIAVAEEITSGGDLPPGLEAHGARSLLFLVEEPLLGVALVAQQLAHFHAHHRFCGRCGSPTVAHPRDVGRRCPRCERDLYPSVAPCMITLVHDGPRILLTRAPRFPKGMYGLAAGFVEAGESLEACVHREVKEETGLAVTDVRYVASQPWPLPSQLMVGFYARLAGGELKVDEDELEEASFFDVESLPGLPPPTSIARYLVDRYVEEHRRAR